MEYSSARQIKYLSFQVDSCGHYVLLLLIRKKLYKNVSFCVQMKEKQQDMGLKRHKAE